LGKTTTKNNNLKPTPGKEKGRRSILSYYRKDKKGGSFNVVLDRQEGSKGNENKDERASPSREDFSDLSLGKRRTVGPGPVGKSPFRNHEGRKTRAKEKKKKRSAACLTGPQGRRSNGGAKKPEESDTPSIN